MFVKSHFLSLFLLYCSFTLQVQVPEAIHDLLTLIAIRIIISTAYYQSSSSLAVNHSENGVLLSL